MPVKPASKAPIFDRIAHQIQQILDRFTAQELGSVRSDCIVEENSQLGGEVATAIAFYFALRTLPPFGESDAMETWIDTQIANIHGLNPKRWQDLISKIAVGPTGNPIDWDDSKVDQWLFSCYEQFLRSRDRKQRAVRGTFYTPPELARFTMAEVDRCLKEEFQCDGGLANDAPFADDQTPLRILDPALGTGVFLTECLLSIADRFRSCAEPSRRFDRWLDKQFRGVDVSLTALVVAVFRVALQLHRLEYQFSVANVLHLAWGSTITGRDLVDWLGPVSIVVGNPPYRSLSTNDGQWISELLKGREGNSRGLASYFAIDGKPLSERKAWLHDDYVKFFRYAHWTVERRGAGIVALVTNHGYLTSPTFRGMRWQLLNTFSKISIVDLHGNVKTRERPPDGTTDENIFGVEAGIAVGLFRKTADGSSRHVKYQELWGSRDSKLAKLQAVAEGASKTAQPSSIELHPQAPYYFFAPSTPTLDALYEAAMPLPEVMPLYASAVVTARDGLVIDFDDEALKEKLSKFLDPNLSDELARQTFFPAARSTRYPAGDTRSWKLPAARQKMRSASNWQEKIQRCLYRPFDYRSILWSDEMIDWPRTKVMDLLRDSMNWALIVRRQMLPTGACNFFWVTDHPTLDGVIRSDNRGNEFIFPLWSEVSKSQQHNFSKDFVERLERAIGESICRQSLPKLLFGFIYGIFNSPQYRTRFADHLRIEYPRVPIPRKRVILDSVSELGWKLIGLHCEGQLDDHFSITTAVEAPIIDRGFPKFAQQKIYINHDTYFSDIPEEVWQFKVGGHQICRKWLKDRRLRCLAAADQRQYLRLLSTAAATPRLQRTVDQRISDAGGWDRAFLKKAGSSAEKSL